MRLTGLFSLFRPFGLFGLSGTEVLEETGDDHGRFVGLGVHVIKLLLIDVPLIDGDAEVTLHFGGG